MKNNPLANIVRATEPAVNLGDLINEVYFSDDHITITLKRPITIVVPGDGEFVVEGEFSVLSKEKICLDGKEVHLNSRNSKFLNAMRKAALEALYEIIGCPKNDAVELETMRRNFKEEIKKEILEELNNAH